MSRTRSLIALALLVVAAACHDDPVAPIAPHAVVADTAATLVIYNPGAEYITDLRIADCQAEDTGDNLIDQRLDSSQPIFALVARWHVAPGCHDVYVQTAAGESLGWLALQFTAGQPVFLLVNTSGIPFSTLTDSDRVPR
jgi:hypothetical protein